LTLGTDKTGDLVSNWHVSGENSLLDHRYILFQVGDLEIAGSHIAILSGRAKG
jgi:hypothetical protein